MGWYGGEVHRISHISDPRDVVRDTESFPPRVDRVFLDGLFFFSLRSRLPTPRTIHSEPSCSPREPNAPRNQWTVTCIVAFFYMRILKCIVQLAGMWRLLKIVTARWQRWAMFSAWSLNSMESLVGGEYVVSFGGWVFSNEYRSLYRTFGGCRSFLEVV